MKEYHDRPLIIFDLDETLVYTSELRIEGLPLITTTVLGNTAKNYTVYVYKRPYFDELISFCFENFDVAIWTAASAGYAFSILPHLFGKLYDKLTFVYTERCTIYRDPETSIVHRVKDLNKVRRRMFNGKFYRSGRMLMVEDTPDNLRRNYGNGIVITSWTGRVSDDYLLKLMAYLSKLLKDDSSWRRLSKVNWLNDVKIKS
jgi:TFIIF-interacting CTD phosphatase-like protein